MSKATREVSVCDECRTHRDVTEWPQIGGDYCEDCAYKLLDGQCRECGDFDAGPLGERQGKKVCASCAEMIDLEGAADL